jgi:hypothetical protein
MLLIAGYKIVRAGPVCALDEFVFVGVFHDLGRSRGGNYPRLILYQLEELLAKTTLDLEFLAREHFAIFRENGFGDTESSGRGERKEEHGALESLGF